MNNRLTAGRFKANPQIILIRGKDPIINKCPVDGARLTPGYETIPEADANPARVCPVCITTWIWRYPEEPL